MKQYQYLLKFTLFTTLTLISINVRALENNEVGLDYTPSYISDRHTTWPYLSTYYYRNTEIGKFGPRINYTREAPNSGKQYALEGYPILSKRAYFFLSAAKANTKQIVFANTQYIAEGYFNILPTVDFTLGTSYRKYKTFSNQKIISYSSSIGKTIDKYFGWVKVFNFRPHSPYFYELGLKRTIDDDGLCYINFKLNAGKFPDIGDLPPLDKILIVKQRGVSIDGKYPLSKVFFIKLGIGYARQQYPTVLRRVSTGSVGFTVLF